MTNIFHSCPKPDTSDGQSWIWCRFYYLNGDVQDALIPNIRMLEIWDAMRAKIPIDAIKPGQTDFHLVGRVETKGLDRVQVLATIGTARVIRSRDKRGHTNNRRTSNR